MTLTPLATTADLLARNVDPGALDLDLALSVATAAIRDAAGAAITRETSTVQVTAPSGNLLGLPGPVISVASVLHRGAAVTDFEVLPNGLWRHCGWGYAPKPVTVTYTHGLAVVPADLVDLTCQLAIAWLDHMSSGGGSTAGLTDVAIDDARESYDAESAGQISPAYIPAATREWLARRFGGGVAMVDTL
jgi:hypothetical protein